MRVLALPILLSIAACGDLPQPFLGRPGATASRLAQPPPSRLSVLSPKASLLPDQAGELWAAEVAKALVTSEVPAVPGPQRRKTDWTLLLSAELQGNEVVPSYTVQNPAGEPQGVAQGAPVPAQDWASALPAVLQAAATQAAPGVTSLLEHIEAARRQSDPNSLSNRPARVQFTGVTGAPGDGDQVLPAQMRNKLAGLGLVLQDSPKGADFTLSGEVRTAAEPSGATRVEIQWIVADPRGTERGRIVQLNNVPHGTLDHYWGDIAVAVATEAAGGVRDVVQAHANDRPVPEHPVPDHPVAEHPVSPSK